MTRMNVRAFNAVTAELRKKYEREDRLRELAPEMLALLEEIANHSSDEDACDVCRNSARKIIAKIEANT